MFVLKLKKKRFIIALSAILLAFAVVIAFLNADFTPVADYVEKNTKSYSLKASDAEERQSFFQQIGITADNEIVDEVVIPQEFNSVYKDYNELQINCGFDLTQYAGKTVKRYTYSIENSKKAVILVYKNRVIGGHITNGIYREKNLPLF